MTTVAIIGCGNRGGDVYARHLSELGAEIVALVDARPARLREVAARYGVASERCFSHWDDFFALGRVADAVVIATPDNAHVEPCLAALALDYHVLLEKPICLERGQLRQLLAAEAVSQGRVTVCHVLRLSPFFQQVTAILRSGVLGQLVGIVHSENVAYWHYAHSYVRGNWAQSPPAAPFVLAKSCHDLDLLRWWAASPPTEVQSMKFGGYFAPAQAPAGAARRCVVCPVQDCPYDARRIYGEGEADPHEWPVTVLTAGGVSLAEALQHGDYGRCVYWTGHDVAEHQSVQVRFASGVMASLTVSGFTHNNTRTLKLQGTLGELRGHMERGELEIHRYGHAPEVLTVAQDGRHGGGDVGLCAAWLAVLRGDEVEGVLPSLRESADSHWMAFEVG